MDMRKAQKVSEEAALKEKTLLKNSGSNLDKIQHLMNKLNEKISLRVH